MCSVVKCLTLNVAGLLNPMKRRRFTQFVIKEQIELVCFQETHLSEEAKQYLKTILRARYTIPPLPLGQKG